MNLLTIFVVCWVACSISFLVGLMAGTDIERRKRKREVAIWKSRSPFYHRKN
jgi:hypothetical protein